MATPERLPSSRLSSNSPSLNRFLDDSVDVSKARAAAARQRYELEQVRSFETALSGKQSELSVRELEFRNETRRTHRRARPQSKLNPSSYEEPLIPVTQEPTLNHSRRKKRRKKKRRKKKKDGKKENVKTKRKKKSEGEVMVKKLSSEQKRLLQSLFRKLKEKHVSAGHLFACMDADGDDKVSLSEFRKGLASVGVFLGGLKELKAVFKAFDADGDGNITWQEMKSILLTVGGEEEKFRYEKPWMVGVRRKKFKGESNMTSEEQKQNRGRMKEEKSFALSKTHSEKPLVKLFRHLRQRKVSVGHLFSCMDADRSNAISLLEFQKGLQLVGLHFDTLAEVRKIFRAFDEDSNGQVTWQEMKRMLSRTGKELDMQSQQKVAEEAEKRLQRPMVSLLKSLQNKGLSPHHLFYRMETDRDDCVDYKSFKRGLIASGINRSESEVRALFSKFDVNHDKRVSWKEMTQRCEEARKVQRLGYRSVSASKLKKRLAMEERASKSLEELEISYQDRLRSLDDIVDKKKRAVEEEEYNEAAVLFEKEKLLRDEIGALKESIDDKTIELTESEEYEEYSYSDDNNYVEQHTHNVEEKTERRRQRKKKKGESWMLPVEKSLSDVSQRLLLMADRVSKKERESQNQMFLNSPSPGRFLGSPSHYNSGRSSPWLSAGVSMYSSGVSENSFGGTFPPSPNPRSAWQWNQYSKEKGRQSNVYGAVGEERYSSSPRSSSGMDESPLLRNQIMMKNAQHHMHAQYLRGQEEEAYRNASIHGYFHREMKLNNYRAEKEAKEFEKHHTEEWNTLGSFRYKEEQKKTLSKSLSELRKKMRSNAYTPNGLNLQRLFSRLDRDNSGSLSWSEFSGKAMQITQLDLEDLTALRVLLDTNNDGELDISEFLSFLEPDNDEIVAIALHNAVKKAKENGNFDLSFGRVKAQRILPEDISKLRKKLRAESYGIGGMNFAELFRRLDKNKDGSLSWDEISSKVKKLAKLGEKDMRALRRVIDQNGDGEVDLEEFVAFLEPDDETKIAETAGAIAKAVAEDNSGVKQRSI
eukprot:g2277.t1